MLRLVCVPQPHETAICSQFEFGVGTTLANAWLHKEAVQTCELPLLAKVFALCLAVSVSLCRLGGTRAGSAVRGPV
jgi:hypothetical protein